MPHIWVSCSPLTSASPSLALIRNIRLFYKQRFFPTQLQCCLTFSWIQLQILLKCCLLHISIFLLLKQLSYLSMHVSFTKSNKYFSLGKDWKVAIHMTRHVRARKIWKTLWKLICFVSRLIFLYLIKTEVSLRDRIQISLLRLSEIKRINFYPILKLKLIRLNSLDITSEICRLSISF